MTKIIPSKTVARALALATCSALLCGCGPDPDTPMTKARPEEAPRFKVSRVGIINDDLAYGVRRGIYVIIDRKTGQEYVGLSGVGVAEIGSHQAGKTPVGDER